MIHRLNAMAANPAKTRQQIMVAESQSYVPAPPSCKAKTRRMLAAMKSTQPRRSSCRNEMAPGDAVTGQQTIMRMTMNALQGTLKLKIHRQVECVVMTPPMVGPLSKLSD